jgi:hypothetical protein
VNEKAKLDEARYFYSRMSVELNNRQPFIYNLSAFLSAARSTIQYALTENESNKSGQDWVINRVKESRILSFFKDKRDVNIHDEPLNPSTDVTVSLGTGTVLISGSLSFIHRDAKGNILSQSPSQPLQSTTIPKNNEESSGITYKHRFSDWDGKEDIMTLSKMYLDELQNMVDEGIKKGFITG